MKSFPEDEKEGGDNVVDCLQEGQRSNCISPASSQGGVYSVSKYLFLLRKKKKKIQVYFIYNYIIFF